MAQRIETRTATCPANTAQADAIEIDLSFDPGTVVEVDILIPAGHSGETGIALAQAHQVAIPYSGNDWIIGDDDRIRWPLEDFLSSGAWSAFTYNTDVTHPHSWYIRFLIDEIAAPVATTLPAPMSPAIIANAGA